MRFSISLSLALLVALPWTTIRLAAEEAAREDRPAVVEDLGDGRMRIGSVTVDRAARSVTFPAKVNMDDGYVEYALVTEQGKSHESLLTTTEEPVNLHTAMLLLGVKGSRESRGEATGNGTKPTSIDGDYLETAKLPTGDPVTLSVSWTDGGGDAKSAPVEDWILNEKTGGVAGRGPWIYNGSEIYQGRFVAQADGSFVALIADSFALINNPREGYNDDLIWKPNAEAMPPVGTPVTVTISTASRNSPKNPTDPASEP